MIFRLLLYILIAKVSKIVEIKNILHENFTKFMQNVVFYHFLIASERF